MTRPDIEASCCSPRVRAEQRCEVAQLFGQGPQQTLGSDGRRVDRLDPAAGQREPDPVRPVSSVSRPTVRSLFRKSSTARSGNDWVVPSSVASRTSPTASGIAQPVRCACTTMAPVCERVGHSALEQLGRERLGDLVDDVGELGVVGEGPVSHRRADDDGHPRGLVVLQELATDLRRPSCREAGGPAGSGRAAAAGPSPILPRHSAAMATL